MVHQSLLADPRMVCNFGNGDGKTMLGKHHQSTVFDASQRLNLLAFSRIACHFI